MVATLLQLALPVTPMQCDNREDWLAARRYMVGASESAALFGVGYSGQSALSVWRSKIDGEEDREEEKRLRIGRLIEPSLRAIFADECGLSCESPGEYAIYRHPEHTFMGATLDALTVDETGVCPVELKNVSQWNREEWSDEPPLKYQVQVQHQLAVTGARRAYLFGLVGGNEPIIKTIDRNERFIRDALIPTIEKFWANVQEQTPPSVDGTAATARALTQLYATENGLSVNLPDEATDWHAQLTAAKSAIKEAEAKKTLAENHIKAALGHASVGILPDGSSYTWREQVNRYAAREAYETAFRVLRHKK